MTAEAQQASSAESIATGSILRSIGQWIGGRFGAAVRQTASATPRVWPWERRRSDQDCLAKYARWLADIRSLADQLKGLDRDLIVQHTVDTVSNSLGFEQVTLYEIGGANPPDREQVPGWELANDAYKLGLCTFMPAPGSDPALSSPHKPASWHNGDRLYASLIGEKGVLGVLDLDRPRDGLRPTETALQVLDIMANQATASLQDAGLGADQDQVLDEQIAELSTLLEIDRQINARPDFGYVMDTTLNWAMQITSAIAGTIALRSGSTDVTDTEPRGPANRGTPGRGTLPLTRPGQEPAQDRQMLHVVAHRGYAPEMDKYWHIPWPIDEGIIGQAIQTGQTSIVQDVTQDGDYVHVATGPRTHLATPIVCKDRVIGVIGLESARPGGFAESDVSLLEHLGNHAAIAIENAQLHERSNLRVAELSSLQEITVDLFSSLLLDSVLDRLAAHAHSITQADRIDIYVYDEQKDALSYGTGLSQGGTCDHPPIPVQQNPLTSTVARQGQAKVIHDARQLPILADIGWPIASIASIPICSKSDRVLGVLDVSFQETHAFARDELQILGMLCEHAAIAIENAQLYADLQHGNDTKNELASVISRALKGPMTSIQGYARLMTLETGDPITEQQRAFLDTILRNVRHMNALVRDLLDLSRIESGEIQAPLESIDLSRSIDQAVRAVCRELGTDREPKAHRPSITVTLDQDLPGVRANASWLTRVWTLLLRNALKYTPDGGQIEVWAQRRRSSKDKPTAGQWVLCAVKSPGIEFSAEEQKKVFEPFYQIEHPQEAGERGTGLELAISRGVVELYGGQIWAENNPGKGGTILFSLPQA